MCYVELTLDAGEGLLWFAGCRLFVFLGAAAGPAVCVTRRCLRPGCLCYSARPSARPFVLLGAAFGPAVCVTRRCLRPGRLCYSALPSARPVVLLGAAFGPPTGHFFSAASRPCVTHVSTPRRTSAARRPASRPAARAPPSRPAPPPRSEP